MIKLVIFDFDGTLVDTAADIISATNEFRNFYGLESLPDQMIREGIGNGLKELLSKVFETESHRWPQKKAEDFERHFIEIYDQHHLRAAAIFPGLLKFLEEWEHQVAILSGKSERFIRSLLKHLKLDTAGWISILGGDSLAQKKPHPLPFEHVLKSAKVEVHQALMVGDGEPDILGAKACGMTSVAVSYGYSPLCRLKELGAQHSIDHLDDLLPLIRNLTSRLIP
ncbi:MAG: HAD family hydrolase [Bdellovibrionales bacterium]|nr:HAD family hydrolase [Bdellovibrionales bacterium]